MGLVSFTIVLDFSSADVAAQRAKLKPDEVPDLIVFSDMQFDCARGGYGGCYGGRHASHGGQIVVALTN